MTTASPAVVVQKYGGSSVATPDALEFVAQYGIVGTYRPTEAAGMAAESSAAAAVIGGSTSTGSVSNGTLSLSGSATQAKYQLALRSVRIRREFLQ